MSRLYLASRSPRRCELLRQIGVDFERVDADIDERPRPGEAAEAYVRRMAQDKARAGLAALGGPGAVLGADTIVVQDGVILGKPRDREHGLAMLRGLGGRDHEVLTAVCVMDDHRTSQALGRARVWLRPFEAGEVERYWASGEPADKAGGYGIQGLAAMFVQRIEGSYSAIVGLPLYETAELLRRHGVAGGWGHG